MYNGTALHRLSIVAAIGIVVTSAVNLWVNALPSLADLLFLSGVMDRRPAAALYTAAGPPILASLALLVSGVLFLLWLGRARRHLTGFDARPHYSPGWTVGAWFIPIGNIIMPGLVVADVARCSTDQATTRRRLVRLVWIWWACYASQYVGSFVVSLARTQVIRSNDDAWLGIDDPRTTFELVNSAELAMRALFVAAGVLAILMMRAIGQAQAVRAADATTEPDPADFPAFTMDDVRPA